MVNNLLMVCLLATIAVVSEGQSAGGHCQTPDNRNGACVNIQNCKILLQMASRRVLFKEDIDFLHRSKCGSGTNDVCCPSDTDATSVTSSQISSLPTYTTSTQKYTRGIDSGVSIITPATIESTILRISAKKCNEYADFAYNKTFAISVHTDVPIVSRTSNCGFTPQGLVVGGEDAKRREFPHMALIGFRYNGETHWECGGILISNQFVLSAAHCNYRDDMGPALYVRLGEHDLSRTDDANHEDFNITEKIIHQNVTRKTFNDIILFKLDREVKFNHAIRPACLLQQSAVPRNLSASGWGTIASGGRRSNVLQKVDLTTFSLDERRRTRFGRGYSNAYDPESIVFAGHLRERKDTCQGDSGGPLQFLHETHHCTYVVVGVTSNGKGCANIGTPAIYTGIYSHLNWIEETVWSNE